MRPADRVGAMGNDLRLREMTVVSMRVLNVIIDQTSPISRVKQAAL